METSRHEQDPLVTLATQTINQYITNGTVPDAPTLPEKEPQRAGCFVTLNTASTHELRGCIGTIGPTQPSLAKEIIENAVSASTRDPRFPPVSPAELGDLSISVDVLFTPEPAHAKDLDVKNYGVIVEQGFKRGLLLPNLEGIETVDQQLQIACSKAGIDPASSYDMQRFRVTRHE